MFQVLLKQRQHEKGKVSLVRGKICKWTGSVVLSGFNEVSSNLGSCMFFKHPGSLKNTQVIAEHEQKF